MTSPKHDIDLLHLLKNGDSKGFEIIYDHFVDRLFHYVYSRVKNKEVSEEIVKEIFVSLWTKRLTLTIATSLDASLFGAAKFSVLTRIRSERVRQTYAANFTAFSEKHFDNSTEEIMNFKDLQRSIDTSISELP